MLVALTVSVALLGGASWVAWARMSEKTTEGVGLPGGSLVPPFTGDRLAAEFDLTGLRIPRDQIHAGGPRKDGIPAITDPPVSPVDEQAQWPGDTRVVGVVVNDEPRAYALPHLNYHEVVNDTLGGVPIAVVFCPLCDSVSVFDRRPIPDAPALEFGVSGRLTNSNVLLYDRTGQALWSQVEMQAVSGPHAGRSLRHLGNWSIGPLSAFAAEHPDATVMLASQAALPRYRRDVYAERGYFENDRLWFPVARADDRLGVKERVVGLLGPEGRAVAVPWSAIEAGGGAGVQITMDGKTVTVRHDGETLRVHELPSGVSAVHTFWFAWAAFHPDTAVWPGE